MNNLCWTLFILGIISLLCNLPESPKESLSPTPEAPVIVANSTQEEVAKASIFCYYNEAKGCSGVPRALYIDLLKDCVDKGKSAADCSREIDYE